MKPFHFFLLATFAGVLLVLLVRAQKSPATGRDPGTLRVQLCASCHGAGWEGGRAPSMLDEVWAHGGEAAALERSIRDGWPENGMPAFGPLLTTAEIHALVVDIRESNRRASRAPGRVADVPPISSGSPRKSELHSYRIEKIAEGLEVPWSIAFMPDGRFLVSERPGRLRIVEVGRGIVGSVSGLPRVWERQDGGLLGVALHPDFAHNGWVYLAFSEAGGSGWSSSSTRIIRGRLRDGALVDQETLFKAAPALYWSSNAHYGARFLFGRDGMLYYSLGDRGHRDDAQNLASPYGKLHRIRDDGRVPDDNPFLGKSDAVKSIWTYGHRNQQGLAESPVTGEIWAIEHGPTGGDELNVIASGRNYGWPVISYGILEDGKMPEGTAREGMEQPVVHWSPPFAPGALAFYTGDKFPRWKNQLLVGALAGEQLRRLELDGHRVVHEEVIFRDQGRVRDIVTGPDGYVYLAVYVGWIPKTGKILRLVPAE